MPKKAKTIAPTFTFLSPEEHAELEHAMHQVQLKLEANDPVLGKKKGGLDFLDDPRLKYVEHVPKVRPRYNPHPFANIVCYL